MSAAGLSLSAGRAGAGPRLGFAGVGWIGRMRMEALVESGAARVAAIADPDQGLRQEAARLAPEAALVPSIVELLAGAAELDGVVIATPSAMHAEQSIAALERGLAVFCQKPLARTAGETRRVIEAARAADRLLGADLSYRSTEAVRAMRALLDSGALGVPYAGRFVFHNAWGPDKPWFYDRRAAGGGCVIDLGTHLIDLALWLFGHRRVTRVDSRLFERGRRVLPPLSGVEDHALIQLDLDGGAAVEIACSWNLPAGCDAVIEATLFGEGAAVSMRNVNGSFCDFVAEYTGRTSRRELCRPPDPWGGRALVEWARRLAEDARFDPAVAQLEPVAEVIDRVYGHPEAP
jgi:predicted dehydrogenase